MEECTPYTVARSYVCCSTGFAQLRLSGVIDSVAAVSLCQWAVPPPLLKILRFSDCFPNTLEHFSLAPYLNTSTCTIVNIHSRRGYNVKSPIMSNRPYLNMSGRSNIVKSPPNPGIAHAGGGGGGGCTGWH